MKFGLVEGSRQEARPGFSAECPGCGSPLVAKCGEKRVWHWAHRGRRTCDHWWENETEWHRAWKDQFPAEWQEVYHRAEDGEKHIADVKTEHGWVIEFQHSYLRPEERREREAFYGQMAWVVDGLRRQRDKPSFYKALHDAAVTNSKPLTCRFSFADECALLRDWAESRVVVLFDFGNIPEDVARFKAPVLWLLHAVSPGGSAYLVPMNRARFINDMCTGVDYGAGTVKLVKPAPPPPPRPSPSTDWGRYGPYYRPRARRRL